MWAYYADNRKGYCVEYKLDSSLLGQNLTAEEVSYISSPPPVENMHKSKFTHFYTHKSEFWRTENEIRLISTEKTKSLVKFPGKIVCVIYGLNMSYKNKQLLEKSIKILDPQIDVRQAHIMANSYDLLIGSAELSEIQ